MYTITVTLGAEEAQGEFLEVYVPALRLTELKLRYFIFLSAIQNDSDVTELYGKMEAHI